MILFRDLSDGEKNEIFKNKCNIYKYLIKGSIAKYCNISSLYDDLFQEGMVVLYKCLEDFNPELADFESYLASSLKYHFLNFYNRECKSDFCEVCFDEIEDFYGDGDVSLEDMMINKDNCNEILREIENVTPKERDVLRLMFVYDLDVDEISNIMRIKPKTVYNMKNSGLSKVKSFLN